MKIPAVLEKIRRDEELASTLEEIFDFRLEEIAAITEMWPVNIKDQVVVFGSEGSGGVFAFWGEGQPENLPILYASSQRAVGKLANNIVEFFALIVYLPYWMDLLVNELTVMEALQKRLESEVIEDEPNYKTKQRVTANKLSLSEGDMLNRLHVTCKNNVIPKIYADDGTEYESLFKNCCA